MPARSSLTRSGLAQCGQGKAIMDDSHTRGSQPCSQKKGLRQWQCAAWSVARNGSSTFGAGIALPGHYPWTGRECNHTSANQRRPTKPSEVSGSQRTQGLVELSSTCIPGRGFGGTGLAQVLCTRAVLRRPSVYLPMHHKEGCFSPAIGRAVSWPAAGWNNPARRGPSRWPGHCCPAGPRAFRVPGRVVAKPSEARGCSALCRAALFCCECIRVTGVLSSFAPARCNNVSMNTAPGTSVPQSAICSRSVLFKRLSWKRALPVSEQTRPTALPSIELAEMLLFTNRAPRNGSPRRSF